MNRYLKFIDGTLRVTAGRAGKEVPSGYYTVTASGSNAFRVEVDLVNLFNTGIIDYEDLTEKNPITVTYEAVVTDDAIQGDELFNEAWVNDGEHDSVEGDVLDKKGPSTGGPVDGTFLSRTSPSTESCSPSLTQASLNSSSPWIASSVTTAS